MDTTEDLNKFNTSSSTLNIEKPIDDNKSNEKKVVEPKEENLKNPARVTPLQINFISFNINDRFFPLQSHSSKSFGILVLKDTKKDSPFDIVEGPPVNEIVEVPVPKPFEYVDD